MSRAEDDPVRLDGFLRAIDEDSETMRLVFADWLEEIGDLRFEEMRSDFPYVYTFDAQGRQNLIMKGLTCSSFTNLDGHFEFMENKDDPWEDLHLTRVGAFGGDGLVHGRFLMTAGHQTYHAGIEGAYQLRMTIGYVQRGIATFHVVMTGLMPVRGITQKIVVPSRSSRAAYIRSLFEECEHGQVAVGIR